MSYTDNSDTPSASATLTLQVNDNGNTGGGSLTNSDTATINITAVNDAPTLSTMAAPVTTVNERHAGDGHVRQPADAGERSGCGRHRDRVRGEGGQ